MIFGLVFLGTPRQRIFIVAIVPEVSGNRVWQRPVGSILGPNVGESPSRRFWNRFGTVPLAPFKVGASSQIFSFTRPEPAGRRFAEGVGADRQGRPSFDGMFDPVIIFVF